MDILMPQLGETVAEGKITAWFKSVGDAVKPGDNLFEIETDKVSMEVPATAAGVIKEIRVAAGAVVPVGAVVAVLAGAGAAANMVGAATTTAAAPTPAPAPVASVAVPVRSASAAAPADVSPVAPTVRLDPFREVRTPERNFGPARLASGAIVTPLARRLAGEAGIDLAGIAASGPKGRIVARDVETALAAGSARRSDAPSADRVKAQYEPGSYEEIPLDAMRRTIAARVIEANGTVPHFYLTADIDIDRLNEVRQDANDSALPGAGGKPRGEPPAPLGLSLDDFIIKALALALERVPTANAVWAHDRILRFKRSDIGVAIALKGGLVMPVIRGADRKSLIDISAEMKDLAARACAGNLRPSELAGGASGISNLGMYGIREFAAIINPPHATMLAVGAGARAPVETADGGFRFVGRMTVTLSCDHRVVDGAVGAELIAAVRHFLEHPVGLMIGLMI